MSAMQKRWILLAGVVTLLSALQPAAAAVPISDTGRRLVI